MAGTYNFNPKDSQLVWGGKLAQGFAPGSYISVTRNADMWTLTTGADGVGTRVKSNNFSGRIQVTLQQTSTTNDDWNAIMTADEIADTGALPLYFKHGNFLATAVTAWVVKRPDSEFGTDLNSRVWVLESDYLTIVNAAA